MARLYIRNADNTAWYEFEEITTTTLDMLVDVTSASAIGGQFLGYDVGTNTWTSKYPQIVEELSGTIDSSNKIFYTSAAFAEGTVTVTVNGVIQTPVVGYTATGVDKKIEFSEAPSNVGFTDALVISYVPI